VTEGAARTVANVVLATAGVAAGVVVLTTPPLRRLTLATLRWWIGAGLPVYLLSEIRSAWAESAGSARRDTSTGSLA
jgi:hypothetical protein